MATTLTINLTDTLEQGLILEAQRLNKSPEEVVLELLTQQLSPETHLPPTPTQSKDEQFLNLLGSIHLEGISDLGENHDDYIGQTLYQELHPDK